MNSEERRGTFYGALANLLWGILPLYFQLLKRSGAAEIVFHRISWSLLLCLAVFAGTRAWAELRAILTAGR